MSFVTGSTFDVKVDVAKLASAANMTVKQYIKDPAYGDKLAATLNEAVDWVLQGESKYSRLYDHYPRREAEYGGIPTLSDSIHLSSVGDSWLHFESDCPYASFWFNGTSRVTKSEKTGKYYTRFGKTEQIYPIASRYLVFLNSDQLNWVQAESVSGQEPKWGKVKLQFAKLMKREQLSAGTTTKFHWHQ